MKKKVNKNNKEVKYEKLGGKIDESNVMARRVRSRIGALLIATN